jgi:small subunit ribosomal protein S9
MLRLRPALRVSYRRIPIRTLATESRPYVPPKAEKLVAPAPEGLAVPDSPTFFSGNSAFLDNVHRLEKELNKFTFMMHDAHIVPLPKAAQHNVGHVPNYWRDTEGMHQILGKSIKETEYRRLLMPLTQLNRLRHVAGLCGRNDIATMIAEVIRPYEKTNKALLEAQRTGRKKPIPDEYGRAYALGRRKTSSARVWVIKIQPDSFVEASDRGTVPTATCLVNGLPAARFFTNVADREQVFRPLKLTGLLASYNVFCLVRGGGTTGQAEAIALGMSKALQVLEPQVGSILKQGNVRFKSITSWNLIVLVAKLLTRDPRMVERKKTNLAKARKAYAWVKR